MNHFLMVSCVTSRLCVYVKAILVYLYDIYQVICKLHKVVSLSDCTVSNRDQLKPYLQKLNIKLRSSLKGSSNSKKKKQKPELPTTEKTEVVQAEAKGNEPALPLVDEDDDLEESMDFGGI